MYQGPDSLEVLERLLKSGDDSEPILEQDRSPIKEEDLALEPDFGGLSLKQLADSDTKNGDGTLQSPLRSQSGEECESLIK